jgi:acyl dehydratase
MTTTRRYGERRITAFMEDPDNMNIGNVIHANQGAREYGYKAALVGGVTVYGWTVPAVLQALGPEWLDDGWVDVSFRRPTYPGDEMTARVTERDGGFDLTMTNQDGETCLSGEVGLGKALWFADLRSPSRRAAEPRPPETPQLTLEVAPVGQDLRPMAVPLSKEDAASFAREREQDDDAAYRGDTPRIHPGWLAARMTPLIHHSYTYGPAIHARSHIQNLAPAFAGQKVTVAGNFREAFERKGHSYGIVDGVILSEDGRELARLRHTTIFEVAKRS